MKGKVWRAVIHKPLVRGSRSIHVLQVQSQTTLKEPSVLESSSELSSLSLWLPVHAESGPEAPDVHVQWLPLRSIGSRLLETRKPNSHFQAVFRCSFCRCESRWACLVPLSFDRDRISSRGSAGRGDNSNDQRNSPNGTSTTTTATTTTTGRSMNSAAASRFGDRRQELRVSGQASLDSVKNGNDSEAKNHGQVKGNESEEWLRLGDDERLLRFPDLSEEGIQSGEGEEILYQRHRRGQDHRWRGRGERGRRWNEQRRFYGAPTAGRPLHGSRVPRPMETEQQQDGTPRIDRRMVTHFLCLVLKSPAICRNLLQIQDAIVSKFNLPIKTRVNVTTDLHVSLLVLNLQSQEEEKLILDMLEATKHVGPINQKLSISVDSIGRFGEHVLWSRPVFADVEERDRLEAWRLVLFERLKEYVRDHSRAWTPHATILKTKSVAPPKPVLTDDMLEMGRSLLSSPDWEDVAEISLLSCQKTSSGSYIRCGHVRFYAGRQQ